MYFNNRLNIDESDLYQVDEIVTVTKEKASEDSAKITGCGYISKKMFII